MKLNSRILLNFIIGNNFMRTNCNREMVDRLKEISDQVNRNLSTRFFGIDNVMYDYAGLEGEVCLPTPEECRMNKPNALGWWSPIENGAFFNGVYLLGQLERYRREKNQSVVDRIHRLVKGLFHLQDVASVPGFIARGTGVDGQCHYPASSNDQVIPWLLGLWKYCETDIPSEAEKRECRNRMLQQLEALRDNNWVIPGDIPGFDRGSMLREDNELERGLSAVHIVFCTKLLSNLNGDDSLYKHFIYETMKDGKLRNEVLAYGFPNFMASHGWFTCNSMYPLRELCKIEEDQRLVRQFTEGMRTTAKAAAGAIQCYKLYDRNIDYAFIPDWRVMLGEWKEQKSSSEAAVVAAPESAIWNKVCPAICIEKKSLMHSICSAWLVMIAGDKKLKEQYLPEMIEAICWFDYDKLHYSAFFYVENLIQEILTYIENE